MYRASVATLTVLCVFVAFSVPVVADPEIGATDNGLSIQEETYLQLYEQAQQKFGSAAVGANVVDDGTGQYAPYNVPDGIVTSRASVLNRMLNPPPTPASTEGSFQSDVAPTATPSTESYSGGSYSIPSYIVECESGGSYTASNPSGAYGAYQIMPSTAAAYGCDLSTPAGQDACASEIYADVGSAAWSCG